MRCRIPAAEVRLVRRRMTSRYQFGFRIFVGFILTVAAVCSLFWFPAFEPYLSRRLDSGSALFGIIWAVSKFAHDFPLLVLPVVLGLIAANAAVYALERPEKPPVPGESRGLIRR
jgi:hypothetical protein